MSIIGTFRNWNNARRTRNELGTLSTRQLADIGILPGEVPAAAKRDFHI